MSNWITGALLGAGILWLLGQSGFLSKMTRAKQVSTDMVFTLGLAGVAVYMGQMGIAIIAIFAGLVISGGLRAARWWSGK